VLLLFCFVTSHGPPCEESKSETRICSSASWCCCWGQSMGMKCFDVNGIKQLVDMRHPISYGWCQNKTGQSPVLPEPSSYFLTDELANASDRSQSSDLTIATRTVDFTTHYVSTAWLPVRHSLVANRDNEVDHTLHHYQDRHSQAFR
jgi:hypothetical protein